MKDFHSGYPRRRFLGQVARAGVITLAAPAVLNPGKASLTVDQVIALIRRDIPNDIAGTVDTLKSGRGDQFVTGIVTTMFATADIIGQTAAMGSNFIIAHEPTFYNHRDNPDYVPNNAIVKEKQALLKKHGIAVWRFHDYWHERKPDGIRHGVLQKAGWLAYNKEESDYFTIPATPLRALVDGLKKNLGIAQLRVIGDLNASCSSIGLLPGAAGGDRQMALAEKDRPDVLIVGEASEWETPEYYRDVRSFGKPGALVVLGHAMSEEPGMEYLVEWLQPKIPGIPVRHIATPYAFTWI